MNDYDALLCNVTDDPADDVARLVLADWLDDHDRGAPAARLRWWVAARWAMCAGATRGRKCSWNTAERAVAVINPGWVRRLYGVQIVRVINDEYPPKRAVKANADILDALRSVAELHALLLATDAELKNAHSAARELPDQTMPLRAARRAALWMTRPIAAVERSSWAHDVSCVASSSWAGAAVARAGAESLARVPALTSGSSAPAVV